VSKTKKDKGTASAKGATAEATDAAPSMETNEAKRAFHALLATYQAMPPGEVRPVNTDVTAAVAKGLAAVAAVSSLRSAIATELPRFDLANVDALGIRALGAWHCWVHRGSGGDKAIALRPLIEQATPLRAKLARAAASLKDSDEHLIDAAAVDDIAKQQGSRTQDLANDLVRYHALFTGGWSRIERNTTVRLHDLERAQTLGLLLLTALGARAAARPATPDATQPATWVDASFTLFANTYDQLRRALTYLRWAEDDVDALLPSLWARGGAARPPKATPEPAGPPPGE
jgi:hypothetical protein